MIIFHCGKIMIPGRPSTGYAAETKVMIRRTSGINEDLKDYGVGEN
jgi:hypothetical protein